MATIYTAQIIKGLFAIDPSQGLIDFVETTKPYHSKVLDTFISYDWTDDIVSLAKDQIVITQEAPVPVSQSSLDYYDVEPYDIGGYDSVSWAAVLAPPLHDIPLNAIYSIPTPSLLPSSSNARTFAIPGATIPTTSIYAIHFFETRTFRLNQPTGNQGIGLDILWTANPFPILTGDGSTYVVIAGDWTTVFLPGFYFYTDYSSFNGGATLFYTVASSSFNGTNTTINVSPSQTSLSHATSINGVVFDPTAKITYVVATPGNPYVLPAIQSNVAYVLDITSSIVGVNTTSNYWTIQGNYAGTSMTPFTPGTTFTITGNTGDVSGNVNTTYTIVSSSTNPISPIYTDVHVAETIAGTASATGALIYQLGTSWSILSLTAG